MLRTTAQENIIDPWHFDCCDVPAISRSGEWRIGGLLAGGPTAAQA